MRISTSYQYDSNLASINRAQSAMFEAQQQISTGKRINQPSDDPFGTTLAMTARSLQAGIVQYQTNLNTAKGILGYTESALTESSTLMSQAYQLSVRGASSATDQAGREAMISQVDQIESRIVELANSQGPSGAYLFGGQINAARPFIPNNGALTYGGDTKNVIAETGPGQAMVINTQGVPLYTNAYARLETLKANLQSGNISALSSTSIQDMQSSVNDLNQARGAVGSKMQTVNDLNAQYDRRTTDLASSISSIEDVDAAAAITKYQSAQTAYQAALAVTSQSLKLSLLNFIGGSSGY